MDDLIEFLRARLDEDEAGVRALKVPHGWHTGPGDDPDWSNECMVLMWPPEFHTPYEQDKHWRGETISGPETAAYVARHDPARTLREITAKRAAIEEYEAVVEFLREYDLEEDGSARAMAASLRGILVAMAAVYSDHPDHRSEWTP